MRAIFSAIVVVVGAGSPQPKTECAVVVGGIRLIGIHEIFAYIYFMPYTNM